MIGTSAAILPTATKLKALYALRPPFGVDSQSALNFYHRFIEEFGSIRNITIRGSFTHNGELLAAIVRPCTASHKKRHFGRSHDIEVGDPILEFSATFEFSGQDKFFLTDHTGAKIVQERERLILDWKSSLRHQLELTIQTYFCALSIAYAGAVQPIQSVWIQDGSTFGTDRCYLSEVAEFDRILAGEECISRNRFRARYGRQLDFRSERYFRWIQRYAGISCAKLLHKVI